MSGSGAVIVMDDSRSMPWAMNNINRFYAHESCGQCTPCREGCPWMMKLSTRILEGKAAPSDVDLLIEVANQIEGKRSAPLVKPPPGPPRPWSPNSRKNS